MSLHSLPETAFHFLGLGFPFVQTWGRVFPSLRGIMKIAVVQKTTTGATSVCSSPTPGGMVALGRRVWGRIGVLTAKAVLWLPAPSGRLRF